jgi:hypothetical protein
MDDILCLEWSLVTPGRRGDVDVEGMIVSEVNVDVL